MIKWPNSIIEDLSRRKVVLFLGAGVSKNSTNIHNERPPDWKEFLDEGVSKIGDTKSQKHVQKLIKDNDYLTACEIIKDKLGSYQFNEYAKSKFLQPKFKKAKIHELIYQLDSRIIATPNVDKIYDTYASHESDATVISKCYYDDDISNAIRDSGRLIIKVHGSIDTPEKMVFSRKQYAEARCKYSQFYNLISSLIMTHTFVFLGCGLSDPDIKLLLEDYNFNYPNTKPHYMVTARENVHNDIIKVTKDNCNLELLLYSSKNNHSELLDSLTELTALVETERTKLSQNQNW